MTVNENELIVVREFLFYSLKSLLCVSFVLILVGNVG